MTVEADIAKKVFAHPMRCFWSRGAEKWIAVVLDMDDCSASGSTMEEALACAEQLGRTFLVSQQGKISGSA